MSRKDGLADRLVQAWVALYTLGLSARPRQERRDLIASDLWEQQADTASGARWRAEASLLRRCLAGVGDDLLWRFERGRRTARPAPSTGFALPGRRNVMQSITDFALRSVLAGFAWALLLVAALQPTPHSLAYAGAFLAAIALIGWAVELRESDAMDGAATAFSYWPPVLATGIAAVAIGLVLPWERGGLVVAAPLVLATTGGWLSLARTLLAPPAAAATTPASVIATHAAAGDAVAIERPEGRPVSRRAVLRSGLWLGLGASLAASAGAVFDFLWERKPGAFGGLVSAGTADRYPPGSKTKIYEGKFWLVHLTEAQGGPGFLALWQKCPHLGCTVPWEPGFSFPDPDSGEKTKGWFRCPCHQSTYDDAGVRVYGPAPRSLDRMALTIDPDTGAIEVDTGAIAKGGPDNATYAVRADAAKPAARPGA